MEEVKRHNNDPSQNFTKKINQFSDLTPEEFNQKHMPIYLEDHWTSKNGCVMFVPKGDENELPDSLDWREHGAVTEVKDQGQCGSCWSFSATGAMEGAWATSQGDLLSLSEEQLVDCAFGRDYGNYACNGGTMEGAFKYAIESGITSEMQYPYIAGETMKKSECQDEKKDMVATFNKCYNIPPNDQIALKFAVTKQPVATSIEADSRYFQSYGSGIITGADCGTNLDHGVLIVGYGEDKDLG